MAEFTFHTTDTDNPKRKALLEKAQAGYGMIPNMIAGLSESPAAAEAYMALSKAVVKGSLTKEQQHVMWFTANAEHGCEYCMTGHTGLAMMDKIDQGVIDSARNVSSYEDPKLEALRQFTLIMIRQRGWADDAQVQAFLDAGYNKENIMDVIIGIAHKTVSNYANHLMQTPLDKGSEPLAWKKPTA
ncbi:MAG: carboxymuconolactone decarboxylase family protein [Cellvibrionaceae bacterium]|nr:carboxymuconolactone decarboxylase family protein [Cellvibrionaceae bacterium]